MSRASRADSKPTIWRRLRSRLYRWKAALAVLAGCGVLLCHLLACVESPMAFSPQGDLAFTTVGPGPVPADEQAAEPAAEEEGGEGEQGVGRLFVLPKGQKTPRLIEETDDHWLCAPAYSPDGKTLCYLRVPRETGQSDEPPQSEPEEQSDQSEDESPPALVASEGYEFDDVSLPSLSRLGDFIEEVKDGPRAEVTLVVRDAASDEVRSTTKLNLPLPESDGDDAVIWTYTLGSTKYSPDGQWIYVYAGQLLLAVNPAAKQARLLAGPVWSAAHSPDGTVVATLGEEVIGLLDTDRRRALFLRFDEEPSPASAKGFAWLDNDTLAVLTTKDDNGPLSLALVRRDGSISKPIELPVNDVDDYWEELAVSPDRRRVAIAAENTLYLLDADWNLVAQWKEEGILACSPTFSRDSKQLACKLVPEGDDSYCTAIVFFSPDGKELSRIDLAQKPEK